MQILLIDDHALLRAGLRMMLETGFPEAAIHEAGSMAEATRGVLPKPDLVLLDIELPGLSGLEGLILLKAKWPHTPVIIVSSHTEPETIRMTMQRGAATYISKADSAEKMVVAINAVLRDATGIKPRLAEDVDMIIAPHLTARQCEVLNLLSEGLSNKIIGRRLGLSENTVRGHVQSLLAFLQVSSRSQAVYAARKRGLLR